MRLSCSSAPRPNNISVSGLCANRPALGQRAGIGRPAKAKRTGATTLWRGLRQVALRLMGYPVSLPSAPWRRWPAEYGKRNSRRYADGCDRGVPPRLMAYKQVDPDLSPRGGTARPGASSHVWRAHPKNQADPALERSRGGFSAQIRILADRQGRSLCLRVTGGQRHDSSTQAGLGGAAGNGRAAVLPERGSGLWHQRLVRLTGAARPGGRHSGPDPAREPPTPRAGTVQGAQRRGTGHWLAPTRAARGYPL